MKTQINSLEALERLIGNDNELEMDIRNSIVQKFAKKYLKGVAQTFIDNNLDAALKNEIKTEMFKNISFNKVKLTDKYERVLNDHIINTIKEYVNDFLSNDEVNLKEIISEQVERTVKYHISNITRDHINLEVKKQIANKFNLKYE